MKRVELVRHLEARGCYLLREGVKHSLYVTTPDNQTSAAPRHIA